MDTSTTSLGGGYGLVYSNNVIYYSSITYCLRVSHLRIRRNNRLSSHLAYQARSLPGCRVPNHRRSRPHNRQVNLQLVRHLNHQLSRQGNPSHSRLDSQRHNHRGNHWLNRRDSRRRSHRHSLCRRHRRSPRVGHQHNLLHSPRNNRQRSHLARQARSLPGFRVPNHRRRRSRNPPWCRRHSLHANQHQDHLAKPSVQPTAAPSRQPSSRPGTNKEGPPPERL